MRFFIIACLFGASVGILRFVNHDWTAGKLPVVRETPLPVMTSKIPIEQLAIADPMLSANTDVSLQR